MGLLPNIRQLRRAARQPECEVCGDTGWTPGRENRRTITLPAPCRHCKRGAAAERELEGEVTALMRLLPDPPRGGCGCG